MKALSIGVLAAVMALAGLTQAKSVISTAGHSAREKLSAHGVWRIEAPGADGTETPCPQPKGMLIYTRDGHMSVQLMYPEAANALSNGYVRMDTKLLSEATT